MKYFLGIDVGSSKTHALIAKEAGVCVGFGNARGVNYQIAGYDGLVSVLLEFFANALNMSGVDKADVDGSGFGVEGFDFPSDRKPIWKPYPNWDYRVQLRLSRTA